LNTKDITRQYRLNQWVEIVRECRSSGQKVTAWCSEHGYNTKSYYYWLRCVRTAASEALPSLRNGNPQLVPVNVSPLENSKGSVDPIVSSAITLHFNSATLEINNSASISLIENTLRALQNVR